MAMEPLLQDFLSTARDGKLLSRPLSTNPPLLSPPFSSPDPHLPLQDILTRPATAPEAEAADLVAIRHAYLPDAVLAYAAVLQSAAHFLSREHLTLSMSLASQLAAPSPSSPSAASPCARDFQATGRMGELVAIFAHAARDMVRLGQGGAEKKRGERGERKRGWEGETGRIWDVAGAL